MNEVDGAQRAAMAHEAAARADLVLFVTDSDLNEVEYSALVELAASHKPILLVLNKADLYTPQELAELMSVFRGPRLAGIVDPENVVAAKADPRQVEYYVESADGRTRQEWRKPAPDVAALRERILEVLAAEGKALVALNAAMYAADKSDRMGALRVRMRNEKATATIWSFAVMKALGVASNPLAGGRRAGRHGGRCRHGRHARQGLRHRNHDGQRPRADHVDLEGGRLGDAERSGRELRVVVLQSGDAAAGARCSPPCRRVPRPGMARTSSARRPATTSSTAPVGASRARSASSRGFWKTPTSNRCCSGSRRRSRRRFR